MANPNGNLAGFTDPELDPNWRQNAIARVSARQKKTTKRRFDRVNGTYLTYDDPFRVLLDAAAHKRGMSLAGYGRRALAAFVAHDLGIDIEEALQHMPRPGGAGPTQTNLRTVDDGTGFGPWIITGLEEKHPE